MTKTYLTTILLFFCLSAWAQFGVSGGYAMNAGSDIKYYFKSQTIELPGNGLNFGLDYRIRFKKVRIESYPTLAYNRLNTGDNFYSNLISFSIDNHFYLFDLDGDCDCPTWSRNGELFNKGFYLVLSPALVYAQLAQDIPEGERLMPLNSTIYNIGVGAGLDIGLTEQLTITPEVMFRYFSDVEWPKEQEVVPERDVLSGNFNQWLFGLRLGYELP